MTRDYVELILMHWSGKVCGPMDPRFDFVHKNSAQSFLKSDLKKGVAIPAPERHLNPFLWSYIAGTDS